MKRSPVYTPNLSHLKKLAQVIFIFTCSRREKTPGRTTWLRCGDRRPYTRRFKDLYVCPNEILKKKKKEKIQAIYLCIYTYTYVEQKHLLESPPPLKALLKH